MGKNNECATGLERIGLSSPIGLEYGGPFDVSMAQSFNSSGDNMREEIFMKLTTTAFYFTTRAFFVIIIIAKFDLDKCISSRGVGLKL